MMKIILALTLFIIVMASDAATSTYLKGPQLSESNQTIVSSGATTTLSAASPMKTYITGTSSQTVKMPITASIAEGYSYHIINKSTQSVSVVDSASVPLSTVYPNTDKAFILFSGGVWVESSGGSNGKTIVGSSPIVVTQDATTATLSLGTADYIDFNTAASPAAVNGRLHYDGVEKTLSLDVDTANGVQLQIGQEMYVSALNNTGSPIANGKVVYITGASGGRPTLALATTDVDISSKILGVTTQAIANGAVGKVTTFGLVDGMNNTGYSAGDALYLSAVGSGDMTNVPPASGIVQVAKAMDASASGKVLVHVMPKVDSESLDPTGFIQPENTVVTYDATTRKVTLSGTVRALWRGQVVSVLTSGYVSPAHAATNGTWFLSYNGTAVTWSQTPWTFDQIQIATVSYDGVNNIGIREVHSTMNWNSHLEFHNTIGTFNQSGGDLSNYTLASTTATNRRPDVSAATLYDEDLKTVNASLTSKLYTKFFLSGASTGNFTVETADIVPLSGNVPFYNQFTGGNWVQTPMTNNTYQAIFLIAIPASASVNSQKYRFIWVQGQLLSGTLSTIQALTPADVNLNGLNTSINEIVFIGKIIIQYVAGGTNNWNIASVQKLTGNKFSQGAVSGGTYLSSVTTDTNFTGSGGASDPLKLATDLTFSGYTYYGVPTVDGTVRVYQSGGALITEKRVIGNYVEIFRQDNL